MTTNRPAARASFRAPASSHLRERMEEWVESGKFEKHFAEGFAEGLAPSRGFIPEGPTGSVQSQAAVPAGIPAPRVTPINDDEIVDAEILWEEDR